MKYSGIGGQAVIEGIMMKNKQEYATAVRKPDGEIEVKKDTYVSMTEKVKLFSLPFVRGVFNFAEKMPPRMRAPARPRVGPGTHRPGGRHGGGGH